MYLHHLVGTAFRVVVLYHFQRLHAYGKILSVSEHVFDGLATLTACTCTDDLPEGSVEINQDLCRPVTASTHGDARDRERRYQARLSNDISITCLYGYSSSTPVDEFIGLLLALAYVQSWSNGSKFEFRL